MALGLGVLAIPPQIFWAMTVPELAAAVRGRLGDAGLEAPIERAHLDGLMARYPDLMPKNDFV